MKEEDTPSVTFMWVKMLTVSVFMHVWARVAQLQLTNKKLHLVYWNWRQTQPDVPMKTLRSQTRGPCGGWVHLCGWRKFERSFFDAGFFDGQLVRTHWRRRPSTTTPGSPRSSLGGTSSWNSVCCFWLDPFGLLDLLFPPCMKAPLVKSCRATCNLLSSWTDLDSQNWEHW